MPSSSLPIPVIDLFAGAGGLGEGFAACEGERRFKVVLSVEKDEYACRTLKLRAFFRQFSPEHVPDEYYQYLRGEIDRETLFGEYPDESRKADEEVWNAELGDVSDEEVKQRVNSTLEGLKEDWILVGGPPCQAFSLVGRARMSCDSLADDPRCNLYRHYLSILAGHQPAAFILENVTGLLSSKVEGESLFTQIVNDLAQPNAALEDSGTGNGHQYEIHPVVKSRTPMHDEADCPIRGNPEDFVIRAENFGVPQARHRVFLLGVRRDLGVNPAHLLTPSRGKVGVRSVISDLPPLRSQLTREPDGPANWKRAIRAGLENGSFENVDKDVLNRIRESIQDMKDDAILGGQSVAGKNGALLNGQAPQELREWIHDSRLGVACNHEARGHMREDLHRYLFAAAYARVEEESPTLRHYPEELLPNHKNVAKARGSSSYFADRFRVQVPESPATTVTSHMSKDGHYFIHYDPAQCRSLTVREAARLQTFPDNYFFEGSRTRQYIQVGNAVPPFLSRQIAEVVSGILASRKSKAPA